MNIYNSIKFKYNENIGWLMKYVDIKSKLNDGQILLEENIFTFHETSVYFDFLSHLYAKMPANISASVIRKKPSADTFMGEFQISANF